VFAGAAAGSKLDKARALGVTVLDEAALLAVLAGKEPAAKPAAPRPAPADATPAAAPAYPDDPASLATAIGAIDWSKFEVAKDLLSLRDHLCAVEATHGVTDAHRLVTARVRALGAQLAHGHGQQGPVTGIALSPDGRHLAVGSAGLRQGRYRHRHNPKPSPLANKVARGVRAQLQGASVEVRAHLRWSSDGARVYGHSSRQAYVTDAKGQVTWLRPVAAPVAWSRDGLVLADATDGLTLRDGETGATAHTLPAYTGVKALSFGARGAVTRLAALVPAEAGGRGAVRAFDDGAHRYTLATKPAAQQREGDFCAWAWSPDGARAVCLTVEGAVEVWSLGDVAALERTLPAPEGTRGVVWGAGDVIVALGPKSLRFVRAGDGAVLGDHALLREADGLRPLEDEKGDRGDALRPDPTFALGDTPAWVTAFPNGVVIAPKALAASLDGALGWSLERRFAWPLRWGPVDVVGAARRSGLRRPLRGGPRVARRARLAVGSPHVAVGAGPGAAPRAARGGGEGPRGDGARRQPPPEARGAGRRRGDLHGRGAARGRAGLREGVHGRVEGGPAGLRELRERGDPVCVE